MNNIDLYTIVISANIYVKVIMFFLFITSVASVSLFFKKTAEIKYSNYLISVFTKKIESGTSFEKIFTMYTGKESYSVNAKIFMLVIKEWNNFKEKISKNPNFKDSNVIERISAIIENNENSFRNKVLNGQSQLATIGTLSPFIGLVGTVFGIMGSFKTLYSNKGSISDIIPSLSEALITTAFGIIIAIFAIYFYNKINILISQITNTLRVFNNNLFTTLLRERDEIVFNTMEKFSHKILKNKISKTNKNLNDDEFSSSESFDYDIIEED